MNTFRKVLVGLIVTLAVIIPLGVAATATNPAPHTVVRIASDPTPTPNGSGCHGQGC